LVRFCRGQRYRASRYSHLFQSHLGSILPQEQQ